MNPQAKKSELAVVEVPQESAIMSLISRAALDANFDVAKLQALMDMKERWDATEARKKFNEAFAAFKSEAVRIVKSREVDAGPLKGKKYAELYAVVNAVTPALSKYGLSASWRITRDEKDWIEVTCTIRHQDGHSESVAMGGPPDVGGAKSPIQARASTVSYLERYTLKAITGLSEEGDDTDGGAVGAPMPEMDADWIAKCDEMAETNTKAQCEALKAEMIAAYGTNDLVPKRVVEAYRAAYKRARA